MHIPENVEITIPVENAATTGETVFGRTDSEKGVVLVVHSSTPTDKERTRAAKANAAEQQILGTVGGEGDIAKATGEIVMQATAAFTTAQVVAGFITTSATDGDEGKVAPGTAALFAAGNARHGIITRQGNDSEIGTWIAIIL